MLIDYNYTFMLMHTHTHAHPLCHFSNAGLFIKLRSDLHIYIYVHTYICILGMSSFPLTRLQPTACLGLASRFSDGLGLSFRQGGVRGRVGMGSCKLSPGLRGVSCPDVPLPRLERPLPRHGLARGAVSEPWPSFASWSFVLVLRVCSKMAGRIADWLILWLERKRWGSS